MNRFNSVLIANRGEIACRVIRTARAQGYRTVAVYSEPDAGAPHVQLADQAVCIGPGPVNESYLVADKIVAAALSSGAQAIHPGYGFLSENADFAAACEAADLTFIGPSADAINLMGNKAEAKRRMLEAGVPCVPGYEGEQQDDATLIEEAASIELPLMVKAAAGGGGRGMRLVHAREDLAGAIELARAEAESAFGSGELILEQAIERPRHVEVQVFADSQGNTIHLGERDCSVQRRHQKVVEEAPCPIMTEQLRAEMGEAAVAAARSINYRGAGTVEFLLDEKGRFYFLEMNTRLQVEHPVTELITGLDLVALQLQVAQGEPLGLTQDDVALTGHAIEVRLYSEDPTQDFLPTSGPVDLWQAPKGVGVRVDAGICSGQEISPFYDPMLAKIIASGPTRETARARLVEALKNTVLFGPAHNRDFLIACLEKPGFAAGEATTAFIAEEFGDQGFVATTAGFTDSAIAAVLEVALQYRALQATSVRVSAELHNWSSASPLISRKLYEHGECHFDLSVMALGRDLYRVFDSNNSADIRLLELAENSAEIEISGTVLPVRFHLASPGVLHLDTGSTCAVHRDQVRLAGSEDSGSGGGSIIAPMHGLLLEIRVEAGDTVDAGQTVAVLEAMKMHYEIVAEAGGIVECIVASAGQQIAADDLILEVDIDS